MKVLNNEKKLQFEIHIDGLIARMEYRYYKQNIAFMHTVVPESLQGKGIASALANHAFAFADSSQKKVMVYCPFVAAYLKKHQELKGQLDRTYHQNI